MIIIPRQLRRNEFRFIKIAMHDVNARKRPIETDWQTTNNYQYFDKQLQDWIIDSNYGVCCGYGNLAVIDADDPVIARLVETKLPPTFTIVTGSGGVHYYYLIPDLDKKIVLKDKDKKHYGEVQWHGSQVIGPGSIHPNGNKYIIAKNLEITEINKIQLESALWDYIQKEQPMTNYQRNESANYQFIDVKKILPGQYMAKGNNELQGKHPVHGSSTGGNFCVNTEKGIWHCFRCGTGGGPVTLIAMLNGLITCDQVKPGCITPEIYRQIIQIAKDKYNIIIEE